MSTTNAIHHRHVHLYAFLAAALSAACSQGDPAPGTVGKQLDIRVAPLSLPGVVNACYGLQVLNEQLQPVWSQPSVCADQFGDLASDITYIGTCDASDPNNDGTAEATVVLTIAGLYGPDTAADSDTEPDLLSDYRNPCAAPYAEGGCRLVTRCRENADVLVEFNITVMRDANQGFFDIAVNFDDIFCSAKVDCAYPATNTQPARPIELVIDPATGERVQTVVWAFACTDGDPGGPTASSTHLYMDDVVLRCGDTTYPVNASAGPGNLYPNGVGAPAPLVQAMVFEGDEVIKNGDVDADKLYWNVALGLKASFFAPALPDVAPTCYLETKATASKGPLTDGTTAPNTNYPYVRVSVQLNTGSAISCTQHGLDQTTPNAGVTTWYTGSSPDGSGFTSATFGHVGAPTSTGITTNPVNALVDECLAATFPCSVDATCQDQVAGFSCTCKAGYTGNGLTCADTDGCAATPCFAGVTCTDIPAPGDGRTCGECPTGTTGDGATCAELDWCLVEDCGEFGECVDIIGVGPGLAGRHCVCDEGYDTENSSECVDIDECQRGTDTCLDPNVCTNESGTFSCVCPVNVPWTSDCNCPAGTAIDIEGACVSDLTGYAYIPVGTFTMGSPTTEQFRRDDEEQRQVTLTRAFWMKQTEVTQGEWQAVMGTNPSNFQGVNYPDAASRPVELVPWHAALAYANRVSANAGLPMCYTASGCPFGGSVPAHNCATITFSGLDCRGYRLPTEAEWEYAARAGTTGSHYGLPLGLNLSDIGWVNDNQTRPVGGKTPNAWGLYDMLGNVYELTWDRYGAYPTAAEEDPVGPGTGSEQVWRGGSYSDGVVGGRAAIRGKFGRSNASSAVGFRLVRTVPDP